MVSILRETAFHFVCNSAAQTTSITPYVTPQFFEEASSGNEYFQAGDNVTLLSVALSFPGFVQLARPNISGAMQCAIPLSITFEVPGVDPWFNSFVPFNPYEVAIGEFIDLSAVTTNFRMHSVFSGIPLALTGLIPPSMDGLDIGISVVCKIAHNLPLVSTP
jgi:hypothetical protein